jgi:UDPglucose 6-dehydrogenase
MAKLGHDVVGIDVEAARIAALTLGKPPFYEPGFAELLAESLASGRLRFSTDPAEAAGCDVHFLCVGTPQAPGSQAADLSFVAAAIKGLIPVLAGGPRPVVAGKSTVPVGTAAWIAQTLAEAGSPAVLAWNPEFLREGTAVHDTLHPDRIVYGLPEGEPGRHAEGLLDQVYAEALAAGTPKIATDYATAELVKVSANSFLAMKISYINAVARVCEATGADIQHLAQAIGMDERIGGRFLRAGIGFGGGCLPKDLRAYSARAGELGARGLAGLLDQVDAINLAQREWVVSQVLGAFGSDVAGLGFAVLGAAFKPETDDVRDSPALAVARGLASHGAQIRVYDPAAGAHLPSHPQITAAASVEDAARGAAAVLVLTEWAQFAAIDPAWLAGIVANRLVFDGRNTLPREQWRRAGWTYHGVGVP